MKGFLIASSVLLAGLLAGLFLWGLEGAAASRDRTPRIVSEAGHFPLRVRLPSGREVALSAAPQRILAANSGIVDYLAVLVGPERVAALPDVAAEYAIAAEGWEALPRFGSYEAEVVLSFAPDLVLTHSWQSPETADVLTRSGIPVIVTELPERWEDVLETLAFLGSLLGEEERAQEVRADLDRRLGILRTKHGQGGGLRGLTYSNLGVGGSTAGAGTTADVLFGLLGIRNAATEAGLRGIQSIDHERLLALDPDVIVVGTVGSDEEREGLPPSALYLTGQADLAELPAIRDGRIIALPPRLFTTTSIFLMEAAEALALEIEKLAR